MPDNFGESVKASRTARGWGLVETAGKAGLSYTHLSRIERGLRKPSLEIAQRLAKVLKLKL